jgi:hypothetical protein
MQLDAAARQLAAHEQRQYSRYGPMDPAQAAEAAGRYRSKVSGSGMRAKEKVWEWMSDRTSCLEMNTRKGREKGEKMKKESEKEGR